MNIIALDIGGTAVKYGLFLNKKEEFGQFSVYNSDGTEDVLRNLYNFLNNHKGDCVSISVPGPFDFKTGTSNMKHKLTSIYGIGLKKILEEKFANTAVSFIHDSASFAYGVMYEKPKPVKGSFSCIMLGTGLGYVNVVNSRIQLDETGTPLHPLWNMSFFDGIVEDYVSTKALLTEAKKRGYFFENVKAMSDFARKGNVAVLEILDNFGRNLGKCVETKRKEDKFDQIVIGGQISLSFDLMRGGFESETDINYEFVKDPSKCALYGLKSYSEKEVLVKG